jgi:hypothetical protein
MVMEAKADFIMTLPESVGRKSCSNQLGLLYENLERVDDKLQRALNGNVQL